MFRRSLVCWQKLNSFFALIRFSTAARIVCAFLVCAGILLAIHARNNSAKSTIPSELTPRGAITVQAAGRAKPYLNFQDGRQMSVDYRGEQNVIQALQSGQVRARSLAFADLDGNSTPDLVVGCEYNGAGIVTIQRGNPDAFAPADESVYARLHQGYNPESLLPIAETYQLPEPADFVQAGDFNNDDRKDILAGARGRDLFLLAGNGQGGFDPPQQISLPGVVTTVATGEFRAADGSPDIAVGVIGPNGPALLIFDGAAGGVTSVPMEFPLTNEPTAVQFGSLDDDPFQDVVVANGSEVEIVHGWGRKLSPSPASRVEHVSTPARVQGMALGHFIWNRAGRNEIAAMASDGTVSVLQPAGLDTRQFTGDELFARSRSRVVRDQTRVNDIESYSGWTSKGAKKWTATQQVSASPVASGALPQALLTKTNISFRETDDLLVAGNSHALNIVRQADPQTPAKDNKTQSPVAGISTPGGLTEFSLDSADTPIAILTLPQKLNGERSMVVLQDQSPQPTIVPLGPAATVTVDRTDDTAAASACTAVANDCSLRGAVTFANTNPGSTINVPAGTYILTINGSGGCDGNTVGDLDLNENTTITGAGAATTIIRQSGTGGTGGDRVMCLNVPGALNKIYSFSALTIMGGRDLTNIGGGGIVGGAQGNALTLTNVTIANNQCTGTANHEGGGLSWTGGSVTLTSCSIGGTSAPGADRTNVNLANSDGTSGGGVGFNPGSPFGGQSGATGILTVTGTTFNHNTANSIAAGGGGLVLLATNLGTGSASIGTSTFSNNQALQQSGGGINLESTIVTTVATTSFTSNSASNKGGGIYGGGGTLTLDGTNPNITFTTNTAPGGGTDISTKAATTVTGTNTTLGGSIEVTTNGTWTNSNTGSSLNPTDLNVLGGVFTCNNSTMNISGNLLITFETAGAPGGIFNANTGTVNLQGNLTVNNGGSTTTQFNGGTGNFNFTGSVAKSINASAAPTFNFANLTVNKTGNSTLTANTGASVVGGDLTVTAGKFDLQANTYNRTVAGGTLTVGNGATLKVGGANSLPTNYSAHSINAGSIIEYEGTSQTVVVPNSAQHYGTLIFSGSGTKSLGGAINVDADLVINAGTLDVTASNFAINILGGWTNNVAAANFTPRAGTVTFNNAAGVQSIFGTAGTQTFNNITVNKPGQTLSVSASTTTLNLATMTITAGTFNAGAATTINVSGNWANSGTFNPQTGIVNFNASSGTQTLTGNTSFFDLTLNNAGATTDFGSTSTTVSHNLTTTAGTMSAGTSTITFTSLAGSISGAAAKNFNNLVLNSLAVITNSTGGNTTIKKDFTNSGTFTQAAGLTTTFDASNATHNFAGGGTTTFGGVAISSGTTVDAGSHSFKVVGASFTVDGTFTGNTSTVNFNGAVAQAIGGTGTKNFSGLTVNNASGVTVNNVASTVDATVGGLLTLTTDLTVATSAILRHDGTSAGTGDVIGTIRRTDLVSGAGAKVFGNPNVTIAIDSGTVPNPMDVTLVKAAPIDFTTSVQRTYTLAPTGGAGISATVKLHYLAGELNGNTEAQLGLWKKGATWVAQGRTGAVDTVNKAVTLSGVTSFSDWTLAQIVPPTISKAFSPATIQSGGTSAVTVTVTNSNASALTNGSFSDTLANMSAAGGSVTGTCVGTTPNTLVGGATALSFSGITIPSSGNCTVIFSVTSSTLGTNPNTTSGVTTDQTATAGSGSNTPNLIVLAAPTIAKAFSPTTISSGGSSTVTLTLSNSNGSALTGGSFSDTLTNMSAVGGAVGGTCVGTTPNTLGAGATALSFTGITIPASGSCTVTFPVTSSATGSNPNSTSGVTTTQTPVAGAVSNTVNLIVNAPPSVAIAFNPVSIALNATSSLDFTITNPAANTVALTGVAISDTLPAGLTVANSTTSPCGGTLTTTNPTGIALTGATIATNSQCQFSVIVTGAVSGSYMNTTGAVSSTNGGTGNTASANLAVDVSFVVNNNGDGHDATPGNGVCETVTGNGTCTLRAAIEETNALSGADRITFAPALVSPILLTSALPDITGNLQIKGPGASQLTVSGADSFRVFNVNVAGGAVTISGLTIAHGSATTGAGLQNAGTAAVIVDECTFSNNAAPDGGAIYNAAAGTITVIDSTLSGNTATTGNGAGIGNVSGTVNIINSTLSGNSSTAASGGGIYNSSGTVNVSNGTISANSATVAGGGIFNASGTVNLANSIIALNTGGSGADLSGAFNSLDYNLIKDIASPTFTGTTTHNITGQDPLLGALQNNGGATFTQALLTGSPALDAATDLPLTTLNGAVADAVTTTVNVTDATTIPARASFTILVDTEQMVVLDKTGNALTVSRGANGTTAATHANLANVLPAFDQRGTVFLRRADAADAGSTQTVDIGAFEAHPSVENIGDQSMAEDGTLPILFNVGDDAIGLTSVVATSSNTALVTSDNAHLVITGSGATRTLTIHPNPNANGPANGGTSTITVTVTATNGQTASDTFVLTVNAVNDPPSFLKGADQAVNEDAGGQTVNGWATSISAGPADETGQTLTFNVSVTGTTGSLAFSSGPAIDATTGNLTYTTSANTNGTANISVTLSDNGSNTPPNSNTSAAQAFTITVNPINDPPSFTKGPDPNINQNAGPQTVTNWATNISQGPNESGQVLTFNVSPTGSTGTLTFATAPAIDATTGTLTFAANNGTSGSATFSVTLSDNGSNVAPNSNTSAPQTLTITVTGVNNPPVNTVPGAITIPQNTVLSFNGSNQISVADVDAANPPSDGVITVSLIATNGTLNLSGTAGLSFNSGSNGSAAMSFDGTIPNINTALNGMTFTPTNNFTGPASVEIVSNDQGKTGTGGVKTDDDTVNITVSPVAAMYINEVLFHPPGTDAPNEYIELRGTPSATIPVGTYLVGIEGDSTDNPGDVQTMINLSGLSFGSNGFLVLLQNGNTYTTQAGATVVASTTTGFGGLPGAIFSADGGATDIEDASVTFMLIQTGIAPALTDDIDANNDGAPDGSVYAGWSVRDSVGVLDGSSTTDRAYGAINFSNNTGTNGTATGTTLLTTFTAGYVGRIGDSTGSTTADWAASGALGGAAPNWTLGVAAQTAPSGFAGKLLNHIGASNFVNLPPVNTVPGAQNVNEDTPLVFTGATQISIADPDANGAAVKVTLTAVNGTMSLSGISGLTFTPPSGNNDGTNDVQMIFTGTIANINTALNNLTFTPTANYFGAASVTILTDDQGNTGVGGAQTDSDTVNITVNAVNDPPSFTKGGDQTVNEDAGAQTVVGWATSISQGPGESGQTLNFNVSVFGTTGNLAFSSAPAVNASTGTLTYTTSANTNGTATINVSLSDNGSNVAPNSNTSGVQQFTITVNAVNDAPTFQIASNPPTVNEDAGAQAVNSFATNFQPGPAAATDEVGQTLVGYTVTQTGTTGGLTFSSGPSINNAGQLTYTPTANASGTATFNVVATDSGSGTAPNVNQSAPVSFTITVTAVNDAPVLDNAGNMTLTAINEDVPNASNPGTLVSDIILSAGGDRITDIDSGAVEGIAVIAVDNTNGTWQFSIDNGVNWTAFGAPATLTSRLLASNGLTRVRFIPNANFNGTIDPGITFRAWDQTSGTNGNTADTTTVGGTTAFSTATETAAIIVNPVNDAPTANSQSTSTNEDTPLPITLTGSDLETPSGSLTFNITVAPAHGIVSGGTGAGRTYTPAANYNGPDSFKFTVTDTGDGASPALTSAEATVSININAVNDAPSFTKGPDQTIQDPNPQTVNNWATSISAGPPDESGQTLTFLVSNNNNVLFSTQPSISPSGTLTYQAAAGQDGVATVTVRLQDNGGTALGGADTSAPQTFTLTVHALNNPPTLNAIGDLIINEDAGLQTVNLSGITPGPSFESGQIVTVTATSNNPSVVPNPSVAYTNPNNTGSLSFTPVANANGSAVITVTLKDNGGTANGGVDTFVRTFTVTVNSVNDAPSFAKGPDQIANGAVAQTVTNWATSISTGPTDESGQTVTFLVTNNNNALFSAQPAISPAGTLTFTPAFGFDGVATVTVRVQDNGGTANGGVDTSAPQTFTITVHALNNAPTLNALGNVVINEDALLQTVNLGGITSGPSFESSQTLTVTATSGNPALIPNPTVTYTSPNTTGSISFTPLPDANGSVLITVTVKDDGGTANGGVDTFTRTFTVTVNAVNDAPVNHVPGAQTGVLNTSLVFSTATSNLISVSDVDAGSDPVQVTLKATDGTLTLNSLTGLTFLAGDGTDDQLMSFTGSIGNINLALNGMRNLTLGTGVIEITTNDLGHNGAGGPLSDIDTIAVTVNDTSAPALLTAEGTDRAIALDSVTVVRDPFTLLDDHNFSSDHHTRIALYALHSKLLPGETASAVTAEIQDLGNNTFPLTVESVRTIPGFDWLTQVVVRLPDVVSQGGGGSQDLKVRIRLRGQSSNQAVITIVPSP